MQVWAEAQASGNLLGVKLGAKVGAETASKVKEANSFSRSHVTESSMEFEIDISKPCYIYQLVSEVPLETGAAATLWGGYFFSDVRLK